MLPAVSSCEVLLFVVFCKVLKEGVLVVKAVICLLEGKYSTVNILHVASLQISF